MPRDLLKRYIWILETIKRHGRITRRELNSLWKNSALNDTGQPLSRRTFFNYREAIQEIFNVQLLCDPSTYEYYVDDLDEHNKNVTDWLLNSSSVNELLANSREVSSHIFLEDIPSARFHLGPIIDAIKTSCTITFSYNNFTRSRPATGIKVAPYILKVFRQRWYMIGLNLKEKRIKTYALDRMNGLEITTEPFKMPDDFNPETYFNDSFGIVVTESEPCEIVLRTTPMQAKYLRALPLHHTQSEILHDQFSIFTYRMRVTDDLVGELMTYGPGVTVIKPPQLKAMVLNRLRATIDNYNDNANPAR